MALRIGAGTEPLRPTASTPALSKPSVFPVTTCELGAPRRRDAAIVAGQNAAASQGAARQRIVVLGDTGCRMKVGNPFQACNDPAQWPLPGDRAPAAAAMKPDLVLHVGDYHYRENACPPDIAGCQGSPWGYGWDIWEADLFKPARRCSRPRPGSWSAATTSSAPAAARAGTASSTRARTTTTQSCNDPANDNAGQLQRPVRGAAGGDTQFIVFDSANAGAARAESGERHRRADFTRYQAELADGRGAGAEPEPAVSIFANHHPLLGLHARSPAPTDRRQPWRCCRS